MSELGLLATRACIEGAALNVRINLAALKDEKVKNRDVAKGSANYRRSEARFKEINQVVESKLR